MLSAYYVIYKLTKNTVLFVVECCALTSTFVNFRSFILLSLYPILFSVSPETILPVGMCLGACCVSLMFPTVFTCFTQSLQHSSIDRTSYFPFSLVIIFVFLILSSIVIPRIALKISFVLLGIFVFFFCFKVQVFCGCFRCNVMQPQLVFFRLLFVTAPSNYTTHFIECLYSVV